MNASYNAIQENDLLAFSQGRKIFVSWKIFLLRNSWKILDGEETDHVAPRATPSMALFGYQEHE